MGKPEGTNLSILELNNIANYLDYFQGMYRSLILAATWQSQIDGWQILIHFELNWRSFNLSSRKMYEILPLHNSNTVLRELIQHY